MNITQIKKAWSKGYGYKENGGVHGDFGDQMAKKTVIGRACKNIINSSDDANLQEAFDSTSDNEEINPVVEDMSHIIDMEANSQEFEVPEDEVKPEVVVGEVVVEEKPEKKSKESKAPVKPTWAPEE